MGYLILKDLDAGTWSTVELSLSLASNDEIENVDFSIELSSTVLLESDFLKNR
jgi:hypothetical protein